MTILKSSSEINTVLIKKVLNNKVVWCRLAVLIAACLLWGCTGGPETKIPSGELKYAQDKTEEEPTRDGTSGDQTEIDLPAPILELKPSETDFPVGYTYHSPDGNRYVSGHGMLPDAAVLDIFLDGKAVWLVSVPDGENSIWAAVLEDGRVQAFSITKTGYREIDINPDRIKPDQPPALINIDGTPTILTAPSSRASPYSHPVILEPENGKLAFIETNGNLVIWEGGRETARLEVNALPDSRLITDGEGNILLLSDPSGRYDHGVLGDALEAESATLVVTNPAPQVISKINAPPPAVFEGITPIWVDLNDDGEREIILTLSDRENGARLVVYNRAGEILSSGPGIGMGYRWRNQLGAAPTGAEGELEVVDVRTPHLTGTVEYFRLEGDRLVATAQIEGYTSHVIGSRNLDMGLLGDFDGEGNIEALLPNQERTEIGAIRRTANGAQVTWTLPVGGVVSTNLGAVTLEDGRIALGVGRQDGFLRIWMPPVGN